MTLKKVYNFHAYQPNTRNLAALASDLMRATLMTADEVRTYHAQLKEQKECPATMPADVWAHEKKLLLKDRLALRNEALDRTDTDALHTFWIPRTLHQELLNYRDAMADIYTPDQGLLIARYDALPKALEKALLAGIFQGFDIQPPRVFKDILTGHFFDLARRSHQLPLEDCTLRLVGQTAPQQEVRLFSTTPPDNRVQDTAQHNTARAKQSGYRRG